MTKEFQLGHGSFTPDYKSQPATVFNLKSKLAAERAENDRQTAERNALEAELATLRARVAAAEGLATALEECTKTKERSEPMERVMERAATALAAWRAAQGPQP